MTEPRLSPWHRNDCPNPFDPFRGGSQHTGKQADLPPPRRPGNRNYGLPNEGPCGRQLLLLLSFGGSAVPRIAQPEHAPLIVPIGRQVQGPAASDFWKFFRGDGD